MDGLTKTFYATGVMAALSLIVMVAVMLTAAVAGMSDAKAGESVQPTRAVVGDFPNVRAG